MLECGSWLPPLVAELVTLAVADLRKTGLMMINQLHHPKMFGEFVYKKT